MNNPSQTLLPASGGTTTQYGGATNARNAHDPYKSGPKSRLLGLALMIGVPWSFFLLTGILFAFVYHWYVSMVWLLVSFLLFVSVLFIMVDYRNKTGGRWYMKLGLLSVVSVVLGVFASLYSYHHYFNNYWSYKENSEYINVLPSEPASAHSDAGKILFTLDSKVVLERTLGYRAKDVYCVAPIMDYATSTVQYWATGLNCCQPRGGFACDDVWNPRARSAVVVLDRPGSLFPSAYDVFKKAAKQACAEWGLTQSDSAMFVRWVSDATKEQNLYYTEGLGCLITFVAIYAVWSLLIGGLMQMSARKSVSNPEAAKNVRLPPAL